MKKKLLSISAAAGLSILALASCGNETKVSKPSFAKLGEEIGKAEFGVKLEELENYKADMTKDYVMSAEVCIIEATEQEKDVMKSVNTGNGAVKNDADSFVSTLYRKSNMKMSAGVGVMKGVLSENFQCQKYKDGYVKLDLDKKTGEPTSVDSLDVFTDFMDFTEVNVNSEGVGSKFYKNGDIYTCVVKDEKNDKGEESSSKWQFYIREKEVSLKYDVYEAEYKTRNSGTPFEYGCLDTLTEYGEIKLKYTSVKLAEKDVAKFGLIA